MKNTRTIRTAAAPLALFFAGHAALFGGACTDDPRAVDKPLDRDGDGTPDAVDPDPDVGDDDDDDSDTPPVVVDEDGDGQPDVDPDVPESFGPETPAPSTRYARLTREQWENTVRDLFFLDEHTGFSEELSQDSLPASFLFDNPADALAVDSTQWTGFERAAQRAAERATTDATTLALLAPSGTTPEQFIRSTGLRAHRRPLGDEEVAEYMTVFNAGNGAYPGMDAFTGGVRLVLEAMLQSPFFLYRVELTQDVDGDVVHLDPWEIASRLSYALWGSMPDDELFAAAEAGLLASTVEGTASVEQQAIRMLEDPRAAEYMLTFHHQLLEAEKAAGIAPSTAFFPDAPADLGALARREQDLFIEDLFTTNGGFADLMTSTRAFVNVELAAIFGVDGVTGDAFVPVDLDPSVRRGLLTRVAFLATNATSVDPDPIHRGVFIARRMACLPLSAPPADIPPLPPPTGQQTNRERVELHTESTEPCISCHTEVINPYGFPFEMYDATGAVRTEDNGLPIDPTATPLFDDGPTPVADGVELSDLMGESRVMHDCYAEHWLNRVSGRSRHDADTNLISRLGWASTTGASIKDILVEIVTSPSFLERSVVELEGGAE